MLSNTSKSPSILLLNSLASVIPAPTRTLYASTKAASLVLYQALSVEHPKITFTVCMPSTVEGDFCASAVDAGPVEASDSNKHGLKHEFVAKRCMAHTCVTSSTLRSQRLLSKKQNIITKKIRLAN